MKAFAKRIFGQKVKLDIINLLLCSDKPLTVKDIQKSLKIYMQSSVYNALHDMVNAEIVKQVPQAERSFTAYEFNQSQPNAYELRCIFKLMYVRR